MNMITKAIGFLLLLGTLLVGCSLLVPRDSHYSTNSNIVETPVDGIVPTRVYLDQDWDMETRRNFWFTSQGSRIIPYTWFTWLELAGSTELFRSVNHMESLRYLPMASSEMNKSGLPVGFALDEDEKNDEAWVGLTCAACHTNQLDYDGTRILIEGAPTLANFVQFFDDLVAALSDTYTDEAKFDRFAHKVLGSDYNTANATALKRKLLVYAEATALRKKVNELPADYPTDFTSFARLDAFGNIENAGSAFALNNPTNKNFPSAPVSYPFLWGTHQSDVVQWNASAHNTPIIGPLVRNVGEVVGVFGNLTMKPTPWWQRIWGHDISYSSSVDMIGTGHLESWIKVLRSPVWPDKYFPAVVPEKVAAGKILFIEEKCNTCHEIIPRANELRRYTANQTNIAVLGTDPATAEQAANHMAKSLFLEGTRELILVGSRFPAETQSISIPVNGVVGVVLKDLGTALEAGLIPFYYGRSDESLADKRYNLKTLLREHFSEKGTFSGSADAQAATDLVYKGRPLNGIWATAPYLHNGSVPNLWELLVKPADRVKTFRVGSREFDPVNVGFETTTGPSVFNVVKADGSGIMPGNSNLGHDYGTSLTDDEKWELVEYMKTL